MTLPTVTKTWVYTVNNRIPYVSVIDVTQQYLYGIKAFLVANGYTVLWSASGGIGPVDSADHTDRWTSAATVTPRATVAAASQGWVILVDGNGAQILITFQGASDDVCRISYSPGALFVLAGTRTNQPTATDEMIISSTTAHVATASGDRVWHGWVTSDLKMCRFAIGRAGAMLKCWGVELFTSSMGASVICTPTIWGFCYATSGVQSGTIGTPYQLNYNGGLARANVQGTVYSLQCGGLLLVAGHYASTLNTTVNELNDSQYLLVPVGIYASGSGYAGKVGYTIDSWVGKTGGVDGDVYTSSVLIHVGGCLVWPWDGLTVMTYT